MSKLNTKHAMYILSKQTGLCDLDDLMNKKQQLEPVQ